MFENEIIWQDSSVNKSDYRVFLLRCWKEIDSSASEGAVWRFTLVQVGKDERKRGFCCLADLFNFLQDQLESANKMY